MLALLPATFFSCSFFTLVLASLISFSLSEGTRVGMPAFAKNRYSDMSPTFRTSYCHELEQLEPKDHTHQFASRCAIAFVRVKHRNDLILADFNLAVGWSIRQTAKFNSPPNFPAIRYMNFASFCSAYSVKLHAICGKTWTKFNLSCKLYFIACIGVL